MELSQLYPDMIFQILQFINQEERIAVCSTICWKWRDACKIIPIHYSIHSKLTCKLFRLIPFRINSINVQNLMSTDDFKSIFSPHRNCSYLEKIIVVGECKEFILSMISICDELKKLTELTVCNSGVDDQCMEMIQRSSLALNMKILKLRGNSISCFDLKMFPNLTHLDLGKNQLSLDSIRNSFSQVAFESKLKYLDLSNNGISNEGVSILSKSKNITLSTLKIGFNQPQLNHFQFVGMKFALLTCLDLESLHLNSAFIKSLCSNPLSNLTELNLANNLLGNEGVRHLCNCESLSSLHTLHLDHNKIGNDGAKHLAHCPNFVNLKILFLSKNYINDEGACFLAQSKTLGNVVFLELSENGHISIREVLPTSFSLD